MGNRNLHGFALFVGIVHAAVFTNFYFLKTQPEINRQPVFVERQVKQSCFPKLPATANFEQATLDLNTKTAKVSFNLNETLNFDVKNEKRIALLFFVKEARPRFVTMVVKEVKPAMIDEATNVATVSFRVGNLVDKIKDGQILSVIPEPNSTVLVKNCGDLTDFFDETNAIPVSIVNGK